MLHCGNGCSQNIRQGWGYGKTWTKCPDYGCLEYLRLSELSLVFLHFFRVTVVLSVACVFIGSLKFHGWPQYLHNGLSSTQSDRKNVWNIFMSKFFCRNFQDLFLKLPGVLNMLLFLGMISNTFWAMI